MQLYNFLGYLMDNFTPSSNERKRNFGRCTSDETSWVLLALNRSLLLLDPGNLISHFFRENEVCRDSEWERFFDYKNIDVPEIYSGPHLTFPLTLEQGSGLVDAFRNKRVGAPQGSVTEPLRVPLVWDRVRLGPSEFVWVRLGLLMHQSLINWTDMISRCEAARNVIILGIAK